MASTQAPRLALSVRRSYAADRERVFRAFTDPDELTQWFSPEELTTPEATVDLKVGGAFRIVMQAPDGSQHIAVGTYREIQRPAKLVFSWRWESGMAGYKGDSLITVELHARGSGTEVVLTHEGLPDE
jgi:uncharacterized protein YndB with AHSA1/START domain